MTDIYGEIRGRAPKLQNCTSAGLTQIRSEYDFLPDEYIQFLVNAGWGEVAGFMFYSGPIELHDVFDKETAEASPRIILIADNMAGWHLGYIEIDNTWMLTDFDHMELPGRPLPNKNSLREFVRIQLDNTR